jgi:hypothetical protein
MPTPEQLGELRGSLAQTVAQGTVGGIEAPAHASTFQPSDRLTDAIGERLPYDPGSANQPPPHAPDLSDYGVLGRNGAVWVLVCDRAQAQRLVEALGTIGSAMAAPGGPVTVGYIAAACSYIELMNNLPGSEGVEVQGVIGVPGVIVTPRWGRLFESLVEAARLAVNGRIVLELIVRASAQSPALAQALGIPVVASVFAEVAKGTPLGWALAAGLGLAVRLIDPPPDINDHGAVTADRDQAAQWESFRIGHHGDGRVSILSWQGFFSAQMGGGHGVYANRPEIGDWETWRLIRNDDGSVSLQTFDGHYLCAEEGGGRECQANRTSIGDWEKFALVPLAGGQVALRSWTRGKFVSVQQDS